MKTGSLQLFIILLLALVVANLYYFLYPESMVFQDSHYEPGAIAEQDIVAPFTFPLIKDEGQVESERQAATDQVSPVYRFDDDQNLRIARRLDDLFALLGEGASDEVLIKKGLSLSESSRDVLQEPRQRVRLYNFLQDELKPLLANGVLPDGRYGESIDLAGEGDLKRVPTSRFATVSSARDAILTHLTSPRDQDIVRQILSHILTANVVVDTEQTERVKSDAANHISSVSGEVLKGDLIVARNQRIGEEEYAKIRSMIQAKQEKLAEHPRDLLRSTLGIFLLAVLLQILFLHLLRGFFPREAESAGNWVVFEFAFLIPILGLILIYRTHLGPDYLIPMAFSPLVLAYVYSPSVGILFSFFQWVMPVAFLNWGSNAPLEWTLVIATVLVAFRSMKLQNSFLITVGMLIVSYTAWSGVFSLIRHENFAAAQNRLYGYAAVLVCAALASAVAPFIQRSLGMLTRQMLLNLLDFNNPLLKRLSDKAPGTYSHALVVGNLAESAAESIGGNSLLARVGSYYHDIGKLEGAEFFTENNPDSKTLHDRLSSAESASRIREHVAQGAALLKKNRFPNAVVDILRQHHGTRPIAYFLDKAQKSGEAFDESQYYYNGPRPQTKEAVLVMLSDIVESRCKALKEPTEEALRNIIDDTVQILIREHQLDEAPITMRELETVKKTLLPILKGIHNKRIEYPGN